MCSASRLSISRYQCIDRLGRCCRLGISQDEEEKQRSRLEAQDQDLAEMRSEQELLRKRINHADGVNARNANEIARLTDALSCARIVSIA